MKKHSKIIVSAVIQARMGSERLPGKSLEPICGIPMLGHIIERARRVNRLDSVIVATSNREEDEAIVNYCKSIKAPCFQGDRDDVLMRYVRAAERFPCDHIARICGDSPLFDISFLEEMVAEHIRVNADNSYTLPPVPVGAVQEVVSFSALKRSCRETNDPKCREHVTPFLKENKDQYKNNVMEAPEYLTGIPARLTVDTKEDMELIKKIYQALYKPGEVVNVKEALNLLNDNPEWLKINAGIKQKHWKD